MLAAASTARTAFTKDGKDQTTAGQLSAAPSYCTVAHRVGKIVLAVSNTGVLAATIQAWADPVDCISGLFNPPLEYPKNSRVYYAYAVCFWIGAVVGRDTLVSTGADGWSSDGEEFSPDEPPWGDMVYRSLRFPENPSLYQGAVSEEDFIATYADTMPYVDQNSWQGELHRPLNIEVTQRSFAWSYAYAEDFILFDFEIKNIGQTTLENVYMGFYNDSDVGWEATPDYHTDDICGFRETFVSNYQNTCDFLDTVNLAWIADNDGDPVGGTYTDQSCPDVTAMRIVRTPGDKLDVSFNWWISNMTSDADFGPREREGTGRWAEDFRDFGTGGLGTPEGDRNKYYMLRNMEFDYDQIYTAAIQPTDELWMYPSQSEDVKNNLADGFDTRYLLSFGPFDIEPGDRLPISFAYIAGEDFHRDPQNAGNLPASPDQYYAGLDFSDLALNSTWASRVYDNPGVDTDDDGDFGEARECCFDEAETQCDSIWYKGDGVPDFKGASPPPAPYVWLEPEVGAVRVRFNGTRTETSQDVFSRMRDFEGYRIYIGRDDRESSFSLVASYDIEDFNKYVYNPDLLPEAGYELLETPFTLQQLQELYGTTFHPLDHPYSSPYTLPGFPDSIFYFEPQDFNASEFGVTTDIQKVYPDQPFPSSFDVDSVDASELTPEGYLKYFEYELIVGDLLPTVEWQISVTAFDFGSPESGLQSLESNPSTAAQAVYPLASAAQVAGEGLKVYVYPNPYRVDGDYRTDGYEGRLDSDRPDDRVRTVHFANLPPRCTISIYTLDGDLIRVLEHDRDPLDPESTHDQWNLITRNTQMVASGIYYWVVETEDGDAQIGKLVVIM
ncbi:MAG: hypothetical protein JSW34_11020 [Candidatus Zixiibacteriota bacterium]|nr:MAG: hypothetical protein JSW34_11020 [candidate division Zixibacteria bacterium]